MPTPLPGIQYRSPMPAFNVVLNTTRPSGVMTCDVWLACSTVRRLKMARERSAIPPGARATST